MPYCPKCRYEYRDDIKDCPDCDIELVEELPPEGEYKDNLRDVGNNIEPLEDEVELETFAEPVEFMYVASMLDELDIPFLVRAARSEKDFIFKRLYSFNADIKKTIFVGQKDLERASEVMESLDAYLMEKYPDGDFSEAEFEENEDDYTDDGDYEE